jgi:hypothetical protein
LKSEIERLINYLREKQQVGRDIVTFVRSDGPRRGWEQDDNQRAGLFSDRGGDIEKVDNDENEEEGDGAGDSKDRSADANSLKATIKSKKAFSMAINDKTMPPAIKRLSTAA